MKKEKMPKEEINEFRMNKRYWHRYKHCHRHRGGGGNTIYGLGVVGALFYFLQGATTFSAVLWGIGKAIFWPALIVFKALTMLNI